MVFLLLLFKVQGRKSVERRAERRTQTLAECSVKVYRKTPEEERLLQNKATGSATGWSGTRTFERAVSGIRAIVEAYHALVRSNPFAKPNKTRANWISRVRSVTYAARGHAKPFETKNVTLKVRLELPAGSPTRERSRPARVVDRRSHPSYV